MQSTTTLLLITAICLTMSTSSSAQPHDGATGYASVNGLEMYYEIHGTGRPLVMLHGGFMNIEALGPLLPALAQSRQVIAVDLEGHGRTVDLDRPLRYEQMADDVAGLLDELGVQQADVFGFSMGGGVALRMAIQHPERIRRMVVVSAHHSKEGFYPSVTAQWPGMSPEAFTRTPMEQAYMETAPNPDRWPAFVEKMKQFMLGFEGWTDADIRSIEAPALLVLGDADLIRPEYVVEMFRLLGGARPDGGMGGVPDSRLAILPGTTHFDILERTDLLLPIVTPFLDAPMPEVP